MSASDHETPGYYLILRGPLGSGKSTVAEALARAVRGKVVHLDGIADKNWDGGSARMFLRGNVALERRARPLLAKRIPVIFDGCFYWKSQLRDLEARLPFPHETFTLKVPLSVCIDRRPAVTESERTCAGGHSLPQSQSFSVGLPHRWASERGSPSQVDHVSSS